MRGPYQTGSYAGKSALTATAAFLLLVSASTAVAQDASKVVLQIKGEVGQKARYSSSSNISLNFSGQSLNIVEESSSESVVKEVGEDGSVLFEQKTLSTKTTMNGEEIPDEGGDDSVRRLRLAPNGAILGFEDTGADSEDPNNGISIRILFATNLMFKDEPVGPGDTWSFDIAGNDALGSKNAKASFKFEEFGELRGRQVAKITMTYAETSGSPALSATSTHWVEVASGDSIKNESSLTGIEIDLGGQVVLASAKNNSEVKSGGMVAVEGQEDDSEVESDPISQKVEGFEKLDGVFPLYRKDNEGRMTLYMEISPEQLGRLVMLQTTASTGLADGRIAAGDPINDLIFAFERTPNQRVVMKVPNVFFRAKEGTPIAAAVKRSFPDSIVESFSVEAEHEGRVLIDVSQLFKGDISMVGMMLAGGGNPLLGGGGDSLSPDRENTYVNTLKNFPENVYVETVYNFVGRGGGGQSLADLMNQSTLADSRSALVTLNYNMYMLPMDNGYRPRLFDSRVGFFTVEFQDFTSDTALDQKVQYITRWNLKKQDPSAAVSDVVEPIVFWIDKAVPLAYRDSVRKAILAWNAPFEKAGYRNAVVAKQMDDDSDFDHADMRYNVVRWITSPSQAYAIALFRTNPITGEILNTSVSVDANIVRAFAAEYGTFIRPEAMKKNLTKSLAAHRGHDCDLAKAAQTNQFLGNIAIEALGQGSKISREEYINQFVNWVVMHEVGHTLGLRHNFVASTELDLAQLGNAEKVKQMGTSASVMDYVAFNPSALKAPGVRFYGDTPGTYDYWAIGYGYSDIPSANSVEEERYELKKWASMTNQPGLTWLGDEFADSVDPYVTRFDLAGDALNYWLTTGQMSRDLLFKLDQFSPKPGESFYSFTRDFNGLLNSYAGATMQLSRFIGGVRRNPNYKGDANQKMPLVAIAGSEQRKALNQMVSMLFAENAFAFPKHYYEMFGTNPNAGLIEGILGASETYSMYDVLVDLQSTGLSSLMSASTLSALLNQEFEAGGADTLTVRELFTKVTSSTWSEVDAAKPVTMLRRQLQRQHLDRLVEMVLDKDGTPAEAKTLAWAHLMALKTKLSSASKKVAHESTRLHWEESLMRINRALDAKPSVGATGGGGGGMSLLDLLGGIKK